MLERSPLISLSLSCLCGREDLHRVLSQWIATFHSGLVASDRQRRLSGILSLSLASFTYSGGGSVMEVVIFLHSQTVTAFFSTKYQQFAVFFPCPFAFCQFIFLQPRLIVPGRPALFKFQRIFSEPAGDDFPAVRILLDWKEHCCCGGPPET